MGLQDVFFQLRLPFDAPEARELSTRISEEIYFHALVGLRASWRDEHGRAPGVRRDARRARASCSSTPGASTPADAARWDALRERIQAHGLRNSLLIAIAPTATIASIAGCYECIEPQVSNLFKRETLSGDFLQVNRYLVERAEGARPVDRGDPRPAQAGRGLGAGHRRSCPTTLRAVYRTAWEMPMRSLIDMAADRGAFIDQSQSLNLFIESPNIGQLSSMYIYAWKKGLKTTYYLRSRPATRIAKTTVERRRAGADGADAGAVACSLENPETCEACQ